MERIRIGFIGAGDISLLHGEALAALPSAHLSGLWNITDDLAEEKCRLFGCRKYASAEALVGDPDIDAVYVLTNLETHHKYARMALLAGKHVFVEKPVGASVPELEDLKALADQAGLICMPGHNYIYDTSVRRARALLDSGKLGRIVSIYVLYNINHPEEVAARYPGVIRQILTHHAYIAMYLGGPVSKVSAMKAVISHASITQEDLAMVTLQMDSGALTHFCASFASDDHAGDPWTMMIKVIGTKGATRYSYRDWVENTPGIVHSQTYSAYGQSILDIDQFFVEECLQKGASPLSTMDHAIQAQLIIEAVEASIATDRHIAL